MSSNHFLDTCINTVLISQPLTVLLEGKYPAASASLAEHLASEERCPKKELIMGILFFFFFLLFKQEVTGTQRNMQGKLPLHYQLWESPPFLCAHLVMRQTSRKTSSCSSQKHTNWGFEWNQMYGFCLYLLFLSLTSGAGGEEPWREKLKWKFPSNVQSH